MKIHGMIRWPLALIGILLTTAAHASEPEAVPGEFVVKLKSQVSVQRVSTQSLSRTLGGFIKNTIPADNLVVIKRPVMELSNFAVKSLNQNPYVEYAEPNYIYRINKTPNDPMFQNLWGLSNSGQADSASQAGTSGIDVDAVKAWDITTGSRAVIVAVIDTGGDYNHPDLADNMWINEAEAKGQAGIDDDKNGYIDDIHGVSFVDAANPKSDPLDDHGHGSHCSGIIGAKGDDGKGIVGVNWNVRIMPVKFLGGDGGGTLEGAVMAVDYATKMGAKIMSNSWGGGGASQALKEAIERSNVAGAIFVAAAGNDSSNNDSTPTYPASYGVPNILTVAAVDNRGNLASFSNFGKTVDVAAPGVNIYSSITNGQYASWSGTSMATPHVSGVVALLASHEPNLTNLQLKARMIATVRPLASIKGKVASGGMVNAFNALTNAVAPPDMNDPSQWASKTLAISSAHPYAAKANETFEVDVAGAKEIALYFSKFDTERNYDKITMFDRAGNKVGEMSGNFDDSYSPTVKGDYVRIVLTSDDSVQKFGFDLSKVAYR